MFRLSRGEVFRNSLIETQLNKSPISNYGIDKNDSETKIRDPPAICRWCCRRETNERFKVCQRCVELGIMETSSLFHYYCSRRCQVLHWKDKHRFEHIMVESIGPVVMDKSGDNEDCRRECCAEHAMKHFAEHIARSMCPCAYHCSDSESSWTETEEEYED